MATIDLRLDRVLGGERLALLRQRLRRRFERAPPDAPLLQIRLQGLAAEERAALAGLVGSRPGLAQSFVLDVREVDAALVRAGIASSLHDALERLDGPIVHRATAREEQTRRWQQVVVDCTNASLAAWMGRPSNLGLLKRLARADASAAAEICRRVEAVLARLPARGITRAQLAAELLGNAHALDESEATATLAVAVLRARAAEPTDVDDADRVPGDADRASDDADRVRDVWARAGVLVNELARPALSLNLPASLTAHPGSLPGEPSFASLRWLVRAAPAWTVAGCEVFVCENPNFVALAADRLGARCAPLVCTDGMPGAAQRTLLRQLAAAGATLRYHGDFDWPGLRIASHVMREHGASPWRMGAGDYRAAASSAPRPGASLDGAAAPSPWDPVLAAAMQELSVAVAEEAVCESLLLDLGPA